MVGKKLISNLKYYLDPLIDIPVYTFDRNANKELPCVVIGYDGEEGSILGVQGHYTVAGYALVQYQGYEDPDNTFADDMADLVIEALTNKTVLLSVLNKPAAALSAVDTRPLSGFGLNGLIVRGCSRDEEDHSTTVRINYDAYCAAKDF